MIRIIHDCDPGNDDALGILVAAGHSCLSLAAVSTGAGHLAAHRTAQNAARIVAMLGGDPVPVAAGASGPLVRDRLIARMLDLESGLDADRSELAAVPLTAAHSAELICTLAEREPGITVVTTGPLTNLAMALRLDPKLTTNLGRIVTLGGAWGLGNKTAAAEWNVVCDPEAATIVFSSGVPVTLIPIDAAAFVPIDLDLVAAAEQLDTPIAAFAAELLHSLRATHRAPIFGPAEAPLNDPCALLVAAEPALARTVRARVDVECAGRHTYGRTVIDFAGRSGPDNCDVVVNLDVPGTHGAFLQALSQAAEPRVRRPYL